MTKCDGCGIEKNMTKVERSAKAYQEQSIALLWVIAGNTNEILSIRIACHTVSAIVFVASLMTLFMKTED